MKYDDYKKAPKNTNLYGLAYSFSSTEKAMLLKKEPVLGKIIPGGTYDWYDNFFELKRNGDIKRSGSVKASSRIYADTLEEAEEMYNSLIENQIQKLQGLIDSCEADKIRVVGHIRD